MTTPFRTAPNVPIPVQTALERTQTAIKRYEDELADSVPPDVVRYINQEIEQACTQRVGRVKITDGPKTPKRLWNAIKISYSRAGYRVADTLDYSRPVRGDSLHRYEPALEILWRIV